MISSKDCCIRGHCRAGIPGGLDEVAPQRAQMRRTKSDGDTRPALGVLTQRRDDVEDALGRDPAAMTRRPARTSVGLAIRSRRSSVSSASPRSTRPPDERGVVGDPRLAGQRPRLDDLLLDALHGSSARGRARGTGCRCGRGGDELLRRGERVALVEHLAHEGEAGDVVRPVVAVRPPAAAAGAARARSRRARCAPSSRSARPARRRSARHRGARADAKAAPATRVGGTVGGSRPHPMGPPLTAC